MKTLLIANRGEIALRVIRTADRLGIETVAVFTEPDREAAHVARATRAVEVPSYLDIEAIVEVARTTGADAVHPGYGFLSERAEFARALEAADILLVGPSGEVMDRMGRKDHAREIAIAAGVPVVPSYSVDDDPATFAYPVLVKAAAGGGGKGMRVVRNASEYAEALAGATREAAKSFGDDTMLIEKYVEHGRHIEVQVMADGHGNVVHFFERDCSTQRRHQKVLEEAPAPTITPAVRKLVTESAVALAQEVGYENAGTVEFLLDADTDEAYFLEMNTRLQVEHPVTELVSRIGGENTGPVDLVEIQLRVADGEPLTFTQDDISVRGHAIEARIYAEDSFNGFLPQAGKAHRVVWPASEGVRVDAALVSGQIVSTGFDPMLGKVIAWGEDRETARGRLVRALDETVIMGLTTNTGFLRVLVASDEFRDAGIDTAWLDNADIPVPDPDAARLIAARALRPAAGRGPFRADGYRIAADPAPVRVHLDEVVTLSGDEARPDAAVRVTGREVEVVLEGQRHLFGRPDPFAESAADVGDGTLLAPMPGTVLDVRVAEGDRVGAGDILGVMEAMKMEHSLKAPYDGVVTKVGAAAGGQVDLGAVLFEVTADE